MARDGQSIMLVSVQEIKDYMNIEGPQVDDFLSVISQEAQDQLAHVYPMILESGNQEYVFDGLGKSSVILPRRPVTAISAVYTSVDSGAQISSAYYRLQHNAILRLVGYVFPDTVQDCKVSYVAGWSSATVPVAVKLAIKEMATMIYKDSPLGEGRLGKSSINQADGGTINFVNRLPAATLNMLSRFRDMRF